MKIPTIDEPQVESRALPTPFASGTHESGLADTAKGLGRLAQGVDAFGDARRRAQEKADTFRSLDADGQLGGRVGQELYDQQNGFLNQSGSAALDTAPVVERLEKARAEIENTLANDEQKKAFNLRARARIQQATEAIERHSAGARKQLFADVAKGQAELSLQEAATNYQDPKAVQQALDLGKTALLTHLHDNLHLPPEAIQANLNDFEAKVYGSALQAHVAAKDWAGAEAMYDQVKDKLGPAAQGLKKQIETLKSDQEAERTAADLVDVARDEATGKVDAAKALQLVDDVPEGPLRDEVRQRLEHRLSVEGKVWNQKVGEVFDRAFGAYLTNGFSAVSSQDKAWLIKNEPEAWDKLRRRAQADSEHARVMRERADRPGPETAEQRTAYSEMVVDLQDNRDQYKEMTAGEFTALWGTRLSPAGLKEGARLLAATHKVTPQKAVADSVFNNQVQKSGEGLRMSKPDLVAFKSHMIQWRAQWIEDNNGKAPTQKDVNAAIADALLKGDSNGDAWFGGRTRRKFQNPSNETFVPFKEQDYSSKGNPQRIRVKDKSGRLGWWNGKDKLPEGVTVVTDE